MNLKEKPTSPYLNSKWFRTFRSIAQGTRNSLPPNKGCRVLLATGKMQNCLPCLFQEATNVEPLQGGVLGSWWHGGCMDWAPTWHYMPCTDPESFGPACWAPVYHQGPRKKIGNGPQCQQSQGIFCNRSRCGRTQLPPHLLRPVSHRERLFAESHR